LAKVFELQKHAPSTSAKSNALQIFFESGLGEFNGFGAMLLAG
jgi:hypothetical protein